MRRPTVTLLALAALGLGCGGGRPVPDRPPARALAARAAPQAIAVRRCGVCHELADAPGPDGVIDPSADGFALRTLIADR